MSTIIEAQNLTRSFHGRSVVDDVSFRVEAGEVLGLAGSNGAGKTTLLRLLATSLRPTRGDACVAGHSVARAPEKVRPQIGYMPDVAGVYMEMSTWEYLDFFAACYRVPEGERTALIADLLELVELSPFRFDPARELSRGMQQRLSLARALLHDPQIVLLDDPTAGLDVRAKRELLELVRELNAMGKTIVFASNALADIAAVCTRTGVLAAGQLTALVSVDALQRELEGIHSMEVTLLGEGESARALLNKNRHVGGLQLQAGSSKEPLTRLFFDFAGSQEDLHDLLDALIRAQLPVVAFAEQEPDLENVFLAKTGGDLQ